VVKQFFKSVLAATIFREGSVRRIFAGPCRGLRYRIFPVYGLAPLRGGWEADAQAVMLKYIGRNAVVYDIGANYGIHTLLMARLAENGRVYAFEPVPGIFAELQANVCLNRFRNVTCIRAAVSYVAGSAQFVEGHHKGAGHLTFNDSGSGAEFSVPVTTLDHFVLTEGNPAPSFIKIDVEGAESKVLRGADRVLAEAKPVLVVDLHTPNEDRAVGAILQRHGYSAYRTGSGEKIKRLDAGWPEPNGLWGQVWAVPES
jgi:FkbM family methyltransferase